MSPGPPLLQVVVRDETNPREVIVHGELDAATAPSLADHLDGVCPDGDTGLALDLTAVSFIDSSGLRVITGAYRTCSDAGSDFTISAASEPVRRILEMTGLTSLLSS